MHVHLHFDRLVLNVSGEGAPLLEQLEVRVGGEPRTRPRTPTEQDASSRATTRRKQPTADPAYSHESKLVDALCNAGRPLSVNSLATAAGLTWHIVNKVSSAMVENGELRRVDDPDARGQGKAKLLWIPGALPEGWGEESAEAAAERVGEEQDASEEPGTTDETAAPE